MPALRKARGLRPGASIGIAAPAGPVDPDLLEAGDALVRGLGFRPVRRPDLLARTGYLAGDDSRRAAELMDFVRDPSVDAIICARGGYGCHRIVSRLDAQRVREARKPLVGYSDITTLLLWQQRVAGLIGIHGPMLERPTKLCAESREALRAALSGELCPPLRGEGRAGGRREGRLIGGSLTLLTASLGTPWELETRGAILLLEEVAEEPYALDRQLQQLRAAGKLEDLAGVGVGQFVACDGRLHPTPTAAVVLEEILHPLGVSLVVGLPFGHTDANLPWPVGGLAEIDADCGEVRLLEPCVDPH